MINPLKPVGSVTLRELCLLSVSEFRDLRETEFFFCIVYVLDRGLYYL